MWQLTEVGSGWGERRLFQIDRNTEDGEMEPLKRSASLDVDLECCNIRLRTKLESRI